MDRFLKNALTGEIWNWSRADIVNYYGSQNIFSVVLERALGILKLLFGYFLCSNITAIYTKITIICAPIFILITCKPFFLSVYPYI